jgi:hypothetical protein
MNINTNKLSEFGKVMLHKKSGFNPIVIGQTKKSSMLNSYSIFGNNESKNFENSFSPNGLTKKEIEDLKKAIWYINDRIAQLEKTK